jgi:uncharacterized coiled-coil DUF342 family protein
VENNKVYFNLDLKSIIIILLGLVLIGMILFRPSNTDVNKFQSEIDNLNNKNKELIYKNDSLKSLNEKISKDIIILTKKVDEINTELDSNETLIKKLKKKKGEIFSNVNSMDADGVTRIITDYLKRRD